MNQYEFIFGIIFIVMVASVIKSVYGVGRHRQRRGRHAEAEGNVEIVENARLKDEVKQLRERISVLERITVEKENSLARQIDELREG